MSMPISVCLMSESVHSEEKYRELLESMRVNMEYGHYTIFPCDCGKHSISPENARELTERLRRDLQSPATGLE